MERHAELMNEAMIHALEAVAAGIEASSDATERRAMDEVRRNTAELADTYNQQRHPRGHVLYLAAAAYVFGHYGENVTRYAAKHPHNEAAQRSARHAAAALILFAQVLGELIGRDALRAIERQQPDDGKPSDDDGEGWKGGTPGEWQPPPC